MLYKILLIKHLRISDIYRIFILGMKIKQTIFLFILAISFCTLFVVPGLYAADNATCGGVTLKDGQTCCGGVVTSVISCDDDKYTGICSDGTAPYEGVKPTTDEEKETYKSTYKHDYGKCEDDTVPSTTTTSTGLWGILILAINILSAAVGVAAVGGIIYGSILYASSGGNPENTKKARKLIFNTVLGLIMFALMFAFLNFLIPGGIFT